MKRKEEGHSNKISVRRTQDDKFFDDKFFDDKLFDRRTEGPKDRRIFFFKLFFSGEALALRTEPPLRSLAYKFFAQQRRLKAPQRGSFGETKRIFIGQDRLGTLPSDSCIVNRKSFFFCENNCLFYKIKRRIKEQK